MSILQQADWGRGWGVYRITCRSCEHTRYHVAPVGAKGYECPVCDYVDEDFMWRGPEGEAPGDGLALIPVISPGDSA
jgi:hypothetical protein